MDFLKRSWLYLIRKRGKSLLLFTVLLLTSTLILCGLSIKSANTTSSNQLKEQLGGGFLIKNNSGGKANLSKDFADKVLEIDGVNSYNAETIMPANLKDSNSNFYELKAVEGSMFANDEQFLHQANIYGYTESTTAEMFTGGSISLKEGRHITKDDKNTVIISNEFAKRNNLKVGDSINVASNETITNGDKEAAKVSIPTSIVGIFEVNVEQPVSAFSFPGDLLENTVLMDIDSTLELSWSGEGYYKIYYSVKDSGKLNSILSNVQKLDGFDNTMFQISVNDKAYQSVAKPLENMNKLVFIMLFVTIIVSLIALTLLLTMWARGRMQESGILLSMGLRKGTILLQRLTEVMIIALLAITFSYFTSSALAQGIGNKLLESSLSDKNSESDNSKIDGNDFSYALNDIPMNTKELAKIDVHVSITYLIYVYFIGTFIVLAAVAFSSFSAIKQKPKELLLKRE